jgi:hypothetical protein
MRWRVPRRSTSSMWQATVSGAQSDAVDRRRRPANLLGCRGVPSSMRRPATSFVHRAGARASAAVAGLLALTSPIGSGATPSGAASPASDQAGQVHTHSGVHSHHPSTTTTTSPLPPASNDVTRSARIGYLSCPAPDGLLTVSIQAQAFAPGQVVTYRVSVHNLSRTTCGTPGRTLPTIPTTPNFVPGLLGPCGELSVVVYSAEGTNVYPGPVAYGCPMILGPSVGPGQTIVTTGTWPSGSRGPGRYRLVIDGKVTVPIVVTGTTPTTPPAPSPPMPTPSPSQGLSGSGSLPMPSTRVPPPSALPTPTLPFRLRTPGSIAGAAPPALPRQPPPTAPGS